MLILLFPKEAEQSSNCPAMDVRELCHFVRCKMNPAGMPPSAGNVDDSAPLADVFGGPMLCAGGWKAGKTMDMFGTSLSSIHRVHGHDEAYKPSCPRCILSDNNEGCFPHKNTRGCLRFRKGNPAVTLTFSSNKKTLEDPNYQAKVATQIDPSDVRNMRRALLGGIPTVAGLKFYVMTLMSIKLFLRADEIINLKVEHIPNDLFHRICDVLKAIGLSIAGKTDGGTERWYLLFCDEEFPDVDPLRHFLIYICFANVRGGYCFPCDKDPHDDKNENGVYVRHESYQSLLAGIKKLAENGVFECKKKSDFRATIHIFRKGAYYFRIIASKTDNIDWVSLRYDARHEKEADMFIYVRDAATLRQAIDFQQMPDMRVSDDRKVRFQTKCAAEKLIGKCSNATNLTLFQLAKQYVLSLGNGPTPTPQATLTSALKKRNKSVHDQQNEFQSTLSQQQNVMFMRILDHYISRQNIVVNDQSALIEQAQEETARVKALAEAAAAAAQKRSRKRKTPPTDTEDTAAPIDLVFDDISRLNVKDLPTVEERVLAYQKPRDRLPEKDSQLTPKAKKWVVQSLRPSLNCLENHHNNNLSNYCTAWSDKWKMRHPCEGKVGTVCAAATSS